MAYGSPNHSRNERSTRSSSARISLPMDLMITFSCTVYSPRLTAVGTLSPAAAQSVSTNSPARRGAVRLVRGCFENFFQQNIYLKLSDQTRIQDKEKLQNGRDSTDLLLFHRSDQYQVD